MTLFALEVESFWMDTKYNTNSYFLLPSTDSNILFFSRELFYRRSSTSIQFIKLEFHNHRRDLHKSEGEPESKPDTTKSDIVSKTHFKLFIADVIKLKPSLNSTGYRFHNHTITNVEILGYIVGKYVHYNRTSYTSTQFFQYTHIFTSSHAVDDGSGVLTCNLWKNEYTSHLNGVDFELGTLVSIHGKLVCFRDEMKISITHISNTLLTSIHSSLCKGEETDLDAESLHWLQIIHFTQKYYQHSSKDTSAMDIT
jgi:hypothetical protein